MVDDRCAEYPRVWMQSLQPLLAFSDGFPHQLLNMSVFSLDGALTCDHLHYKGHKLPVTQLSLAVRHWTGEAFTLFVEIYNMLFSVHVHELSAQHSCIKATQSGANLQKKYINMPAAQCSNAMVRMQNTRCMMLWVDSKHTHIQYIPLHASG